VDDVPGDNGSIEQVKLPARASRADRNLKDTSWIRIRDRPGANLAPLR
jgi:hypothetical protein